jgi:mitotic spindle assembly checkpoint protein MAD1
LRNSIATLREEHADLKDAHESLSRQTSQSSIAQRAQISTLTRQVSSLEAELVEARRITEERVASLAEMQDELDALSAEQEKSIRQDAETETWGVLREELSRQAVFLRTLETQNAKLTTEVNMLRERNTSVEVLKEKNRELERKLVGADQARESVIRLEAELNAARKEREEWFVRPAACMRRSHLLNFLGRGRPRSPLLPRKPLSLSHKAYPRCVSSTLNFLKTMAQI